MLSALLPPLNSKRRTVLITRVPHNNGMHRRPGQPQTKKLWLKLTCVLFATGAPLRQFNLLHLYILSETRKSPLLIITAGPIQI
jgi:hypothetical protein